MHRTTLRTLAAISICAIAVGNLPAQSAERSPDANAIPETFRFPIQAEQDADGAPAGIWAGATDYKVSFGDAVRFYPVLGSSYPHNLPVSWTTTSVTAGGVELLDPRAEPTTWHDEWRFESRHEKFTEAYDVLLNGLEQTFVFRDRPETAGDLIVRGRIETSLHASASEGGYDGIEFVDESGTAIVRYGAAVAIDARGRRTAMSMRFDRDILELIVDGAFVESADFPLTIDPLVSSSIVRSGANTIQDAGICHDAQSNQVVSVVSRYSSASDLDLYLQYRRAVGGYLSYTMSFATSVSPRSPRIAFVAGAQAWIAVFEVETSTFVPRHEIGYSVAMSGQPQFSWTTLSQPTGTSRRRPDVGGTVASSSGTKAMIVYEEDSGTTESAATLIGVQQIDIVNGTFSNTATLGSSGRDRGRPSINAISSGGSDDWMFVFQELDTSSGSDDWDLRVGRVDPNMTITVDPLTVLGTSADSTHSIAPRLAGAAGRYMVTYNALTNFGFPVSTMTGPEIRATRFDWFEASPAPSILGDFRIRIAAANLANVDLAFDTTTTGHWASASQLFSPVFGARSITIQRIVDTQVVETAEVGGSPDTTTAYAVAYDVAQQGFRILYQSDAAGTIWSTLLLHPTTSTPVIYGASCGAVPPWNATIGSEGIPLAGTRDFRVTMNGGAAPNVALVSLAGAAVPLDALGFTGCSANVDLGASFLASIPGTPTSFDSEVAIPLPGSFSGDIFFQWAFIAPGINPNGLGFTHGLQVSVVQ